MAARTPEQRFATPDVGWRGLIAALQLLRACLQIRVAVVVIALHALPLSPYVRIAEETAQGCLYLGGRGLWRPGWAASCPRVVLRRHFYVDY